MRTAVLSVIYPEVKPYVFEFLSSLSTQTNKDFTLFLINNGFKGIDMFLKKVDLDVQVIKKRGSPAKLRKDGIEWVVSSGVKTIIFADADDYFADNRIEVLKRMLADYDIVCNEMALVGQGIPYPMTMLEKFFENKMEIHKEHIATGNCMGLTNTAASAEIINRYFQLIPDAITAFDWALFALCIHAGAHTVFTNETKTYYRQHADNTASPRCFSEKQIMRGVAVKRDHYRFLSGFYKEYALLADSFKDLFVRLRNNKKLKQKYCRAVKDQASAAGFWWGPIKLAEELGL